MKTTLAGMVVAIAAWAAAPAEACSSAMTVDMARKNKDAASTHTATDVAREILDEEGISPDICVDVKGRLYGDKTTSIVEDATTLEAATGTLLAEKFGKVEFIDETGGTMDYAAWKTFLTATTAGYGGGHAGVVTVRDHAVWHALDIAAQAGATTPTGTTDGSSSTDGTGTDGTATEPAPVSTDGGSAPAPDAEPLPLEHWAG